MMAVDMFQMVAFLHNTKADALQIVLPIVHQSDLPIAHPTDPPTDPQNESDLMMKTLMIERTITPILSMKEAEVSPHTKSNWNI